MQNTNNMTIPHKALYWIGTFNHNKVEKVVEQVWPNRASMIIVIQAQMVPNS